MQWLAQMKDELLQSDGLIYSQIKGRLHDLITLTAIVNKKAFHLLWADKKFVLDDNVFTIHRVDNLTDIIPICFRRQLIQLGTGKTYDSSPETIGIGLGFQGNDPDGNNIKCHILISPDGSFKVEV